MSELRRLHQLPPHARDRRRNHIEELGRRGRGLWLPESWRKWVRDAPRQRHVGIVVGDDRLRASLGEDLVTAPLFLLLHLRLR